MVNYINAIIDITPYHKITPHTINLIPIHKRNQTSDHHAECSACFLSLVWIYSPINAPAIGPTINHKGGKKNSPPISPMVDHRVPYFVPPNFFVPRWGIV